LHAGETSKRNFEATREAMLSVGVNLTGVMLNKVPKHKAGEHYGYTYSDPQMGYYRYSYMYSPVQGDGASSNSKSVKSKFANMRVSKSKTQEITPPETPKVLETKSEFDLLLEEIKKK